MMRILLLVAAMGFVCTTSAEGALKVVSRECIVQVDGSTVCQSAQVEVRRPVLQAVVAPVRFITRVKPLRTILKWRPFRRGKARAAARFCQ